MLKYDTQNGVWASIGRNFHRITCLDYSQGQLWVGTDNDGLWRYDMGVEKWHRWGLEEGLPDLHISRSQHDKTCLRGSDRYRRAAW
ncbi:MAG: hypothetical protein R3C05_11995 [Pirellulaceae bacterium]